MVQEIIFASKFFLPCNIDVYSVNRFVSSCLLCNNCDRHYQRLLLGDFLFHPSCKCELHIAQQLTLEEHPNKITKNDDLCLG